METTKIEVEITEHRHWTASRVRKVCVDNNLYTLGTNEEYSKMLDMVMELKPTTTNIYRVAKDIEKHSEGQDVENIMYMLAERIITTFEVKEPEEKI